MSLNHTILSARRPKLETRTKRISTSRRGPLKRGPKNSEKTWYAKMTFFDLFWSLFDIIIFIIISLIITFHHVKNHSKTLFFEKGQKWPKNVKKGPKTPKTQKVQVGTCCTPQNAFFRQNYIREKPPKVAKSAKNRPFSGVKKPLKIDFFRPSFFDVDVIVTISWRCNASHRNFFVVINTYTYAHIKKFAPRSAFFAIFYTLKNKPYFGPFGLTNLISVLASLQYFLLTYFNPNINKCYHSTLNSIVYFSSLIL